jgi:hypothetical protein
MISKTENYLLEKFGPLLSLANLAGLLGRSIGGLRLSLTQNSEMAAKFKKARKKIGRRVYFRSSVIAQVLDEEN